MQIKKNIKIWIDIENTPHVPFFLPFIKRLNEDGLKIVITSRNYGGITKILEDNNIKHICIHTKKYKNRLMKIVEVVKTILKLSLTIKKEGDIVCSLSHGSRAHIGASFLLGIPALTSYDYEYSSKFLIHKLAKLVLVPKFLTEYINLYQKKYKHKIKYYEGFKEQVYIKKFRTIPEYLKKNGINTPIDKMIALIRPPAFSAHYVSNNSKDDFKKLIHFLINKKFYVIVSPRDDDQRRYVISVIKEYKDIHILQNNLDGLNLLNSVDVVFSGGGTMTREAAILGIPSFSYFSGKVGEADKNLIKLQRLNLLSDVNDLELLFYKDILKRKYILESKTFEEIYTLLLDFIYENIKTK